MNGGPSSPVHRTEIDVEGRRYRHIVLPDRLAGLPRALRVLAETTLRFAPEEIGRYADWLESGGKTGGEIAFWPSRLLMHDTTCVPALVDFAAMRDVAVDHGWDAHRINPQIPVHLVIDHSVMAEVSGRPGAYERNIEMDFARNSERYRLFRWAQNSLDNFTVTPPGTGILHQINLERLATVVQALPGDGGEPELLVADTLVGTDSHTPMINGLGILGWGVGGMDGQMASLGQPLAVALPRVVGVELTGRLASGLTATDLALTLTQRLRDHGVVGAFVEFFGSGLETLTVADRATIANMSPEYGATCAYFPIDGKTIAYLKMTGRDPHHCARIAAYARAQGLWHDPATVPVYSDRLDLDLSTIGPTLAGPRNPHNRVALSAVGQAFRTSYGLAESGGVQKRVAPEGDLPEGAVVIAAITSCTTTANPHMMILAGLLARNARARGLSTPWWVKTSLSPGSRATARYLERTGLQDDLDALGYQITGFGCMTCIGNSGTLPKDVTSAMARDGITPAAVLSGNRNFEGRINPAVNAAFLASPPLVVAFGLAGTVDIDLATEPLGRDSTGAPVHLADIWPDAQALERALASVGADSFAADDDRAGDPALEHWNRLDAASGLQFAWDPSSDYIRRPSYVTAGRAGEKRTGVIENARALLVLGDDITTDHISPAGAIPIDSAAGRYLLDRGVEPARFNQYSTRRGNHEVMVRGAFTNRQLVNALVDAEEPAPGVTRLPDGSIVPLTAAAKDLADTGVPAIILAGERYGTGSSRDWGAKGPALLGVKAVVARSFERIHWLNLVALGLLPLRITDGWVPAERAGDPQLRYSIAPVGDELAPKCRFEMIVSGPGDRYTVPLELNVETGRDIDILRAEGVFRQMFGKLERLTV